MNTSDSERQPLLDSATGKPRKTPLPLAQLAIICLVRLAEPIAYTQIFPYVNQMVEELGIASKPADIGFYSGLVDGLFAVAQLFTVYQWGKLSDRIGRRPVIISGLLGVSVGSLIFGFSKSLPQMLLARALAGGLTGNVVILTSILSEISDATNQAQIFVFSGATWSVGSIIGPIIGGSLSHPAERHPHLFGSFQVLKDFPFLLPCFVSFSLTMASIAMAYFFLNETLPSKVLANKVAQAKRSGHDGSSLASSSSSPTPVRSEPDSSQSDQQAPLKKLFKIPRIRIVLWSSFLLSFIITAYEAVYVLFAYTPIPLGGMARTPSQIGYILGSTGIIGIVNAMILFPILHDRFGTRGVYTMSMAAWPLTFIAMPVLSAMVRPLMKYPQTAELAISVGLVVISMVGRLGGMSTAANIIVIKSSAPDAQSLGATFGFVYMVNCLGRAIGPAFGGSLFALSVDRQLLGGDLVWFIMVFIGCLGVWTASLARER